MTIAFDAAKHAWTKAVRGLDFHDAAKIFAGNELTLEDDRFDYGEMRLQTIGTLDGKLVLVVWTPRADTRHIISMRKCNDREKAKFLPILDRLGKG